MQELVYEVGEREIVLGIPDDADEDEVAAISAAISATIETQGVEEEETKVEMSRWKMSARCSMVNQRQTRIPLNKNLDRMSGWKIASRSDRF